MDTLFTGQNRIELERVASTNSYALELLKKEKAPEGTLVYTFHQEKGRGQRQNTWQGEPGKNLALSFVFYPHFLSLQKQFGLTMACSLAVKKFAEGQLGKNHTIKIKWPNDVYVEDKKIAGILIENSLKGEQIVFSVCGFGININQEIFPGNIPNPASLKNISGREYNLEECTERFCSHLEKEYLRLRSGKEKEIREEYLIALYRKDEWWNYKRGGNVFAGCIRGVDDSGKLLVEEESGKISAFDFKGLEFFL